MIEAVSFAALRKKLGRPLFFWILLIVLAGSTHAQTVSCPGQSLQAAVNSATPGAVITVIGTCTEIVFISNFAHLTIEAPTLGSATIVAPLDSDVFDVMNSGDIRLVNLVIVGGSGSGISVSSSSQVVVSNCTVQNNPLGFGILVTSRSELRIQRSTVQSNALGVAIFDDSIGRIQDSTIVNNTEGVLAARGSDIGFGGANDIGNNSDVGVILQDSSRARFGGAGSIFTTIEGNATAGILVGAQGLLRLGPGTKVRNNGSACPTDPTCGGILAVNSSVVILNAADISDNFAAGLVAQQAVEVGLDSTTVNNNAGDGIRLQRISIGNFTVGNTFSGNGGAAVFCDSTSLVVGDVSTVPKNALSCKQIEQANGAVRPGKAKVKVKEPE
jgi:parallel beta-helix repeat protein